MTSTWLRNLYIFLHRGVMMYPAAPMTPKHLILKMQFLLKRSKMDSIFWFEAPIDEKLLKNSYFLLFFQVRQTGCGTCFLGRCMTKPHFFSSIGGSEDFFIVIFELYAKNCSNTGTHSWSDIHSGTSSPPHEHLCRGFLVISWHIRLTGPLKWQQHVNIIWSVF